MNADTTSSPHPAPAPAPGGIGLDIVFDPFRLAGSLLERYRWVILSAVLGLMLFLAAGHFRASDRYEAMARLIKREPSTTFRAGEIGDPYKPRSLSTATLITSALSDNVLTRVSAQADPPISVGMLRLNTDAVEIRNTDFLQLTARRTESAQAAADLVNLWAAEIVEFSRELQTRESREVRTYLQQQIETTDADLNRINQEMLAFSRRENLVDAEKQTDVFLRQLADLDLRYETARIDLQTVEFKLKALESELARYSANDDRLITARAELQDALGRFTEKNPIVQNLQAKVAALESAAADKGRELSLADYASTAIGGTLYLELIDLRARRDGAEKQLAGLTELRDSARARVEELPEKVAALARQKLVQRGLETARQLLASRLREATLYSERAPGYYQIFSTATPQSVASTSRTLKLFVYAAAGLVLGGGFGVFLVIVREVFDQRLRSAFEARRIFKAPLLATLEPGANPASTVRSLWVTWATPAAAENRPAVLWAPAATPSEGRLWGALLAEAFRLQPELITVDAGTSAHPSLPGAIRLDPAALPLASAQAAAHNSAPSDFWARLSGDTVEPALTLAREWGGAVLVISADHASISTWQRQARLLRDAGIRLHGLIVTDALPWWKRRRSS